MKKLSVILFLLSFSLIKSQIQQIETFKNTSLDVITNAESAAMGESFVANPKNNYSFFENPASLPLEASQAFYNYRDGFLLNSNTANYFAIGATTVLPYGRFGFSYNHFSTGPLPYNNNGSDTTIDDINRTIIVSYANNVFKNFSVGVSIKFFNHTTPNSLGLVSETESNTSVLCDLGLLYSFPFLVRSKRIDGDLTVGASIQNFGTDYKERNIIPSDLSPEYINIILPRYLRVGFAFNFSFKAYGQNSSNVDFLLTGEYKNLMNPMGQRPIKNQFTEIFDELDKRDYYGFGFEGTVWKLLSLRIGGYRIPEDSNQLFDRGKFYVRYGAGIDLPLRRAGIELPVNIKIDYTFIPANQITNYDYITGTANQVKPTLHVFSISVSYNDLPY
jgi:hypothetical protein